MLKELFLLSHLLTVAVGTEFSQDNLIVSDYLPFSTIGEGAFEYGTDTDYNAPDVFMIRANRLVTENSSVSETSSEATCSNTGAPFTDAERQIFLSKHNDYRSQLTLGKSSLPDGTYASSAADMYSMSYDCELEKIAQAWAQNCKFQHSPSSSRNAGENLYALFTAPGGNWRDQIISQPSDSWWSELKEYGGITKNNVTLTMDVFNKGIGHWSQMAWSRTRKVGCGWAECPQGGTVMHFVVCNYRPTGNYINQNIYQIGRPCSSCSQSSSSQCTLSTGLCSA